MPTPFEYINSYNSKSADLMQTPDDVKKFNQFIVNKALSMHIETVLFANEMNQAYQLDNDMVHAFYMHGIPKGKRKSAWQKKDKDSEDINKIMQYYEVNSNVAEHYFKLLSEKQLSVIRELLSEGGKHGRKSNRGVT